MYYDSGRGGMGGYGGGEYDGPAGAPEKKATPSPKGSIAAGCFGGRQTLVVLQSYHVHRQIAALLQELRDRSAGKRPAPAKADKAPAPARRKPPVEPPPPPSPPEPPAGDPFGGEPGSEPPYDPFADDPFGSEPVAKPSAEGPSSSVDDPFSE